MVHAARWTTVIAMGAVAATTVAAQDLTPLCQSISKVTVGQWASYTVKGGQMDGAKMRFAIVSSERHGDSTLYWFEISHTSAKDPARNGIMQMLMPGFGLQATGVRGLIVKPGAQPAMRMPDQMVNMMEQRMGQTNPALEMAHRCATAHPLGWETVSVPAGSLRALHVKDAQGEAWVSQDVPFGLVKLRTTDGGETVLTADGKDAKSSITETPQQMPGMMLNRP